MRESDTALPARRHVALTDVLEFIVDNRGRTCPVAPGGFPLIATNCIKPDSREAVFENVRYVDSETYENWFRAHLAPGDVVFTCKGTPGRVALVPDPVPYCIAQDMVGLRADPNVIDPLYLYYRLRARDVQLKIANMHVGSLIPHFKKGDFPNLRFEIHCDIAIQRRIARVLGAIDDLIDANVAEAHRLDSLCRALGRRFIQMCWGGQSVRLEEVAVIQKGYSYKSAELITGTGWLVNLKNVGRDGAFRQSGLKPLSARNKSVHEVDNGDLFVAQTDLTQNRDIIGRPIRVRRGSARGILVASLDLAIVRPGPRLTREYLYAVLDSQEFRDHALGFCNGTTVLHMGSAALPTFEVPVPDEPNLSQFSGQVRVLREAADAALLEADRLKGIRDELLPLLVSGRVRVSELVGAA